VAAARHTRRSQARALPLQLLLLQQPVQQLRAAVHLNLPAQWIWTLQAQRASAAARLAPLGCLGWLKQQALHLLLVCHLALVLALGALQQEQQFQALAQVAAAVSSAL
jgi:hypothetical protein